LLTHFVGPKFRVYLHISCHWVSVALGIENFRGGGGGSQEAAIFGQLQIFDGEICCS